MGESLDRLNQNLAKIENLSKRLVAALSARKPGDAGLEGPGQDLFLKTGMALWQEALTNPARLMERQVEYWGQALTHYAEVQKELAKGHLALEGEPAAGPEDKRFANPLWRTHPYFNFVKNQYLISAEAMKKAVEDLEGLTPRDRKRVEFFAGQIIEMFSPTNYFATNPDALEKAVETEGESLVKGLENLVRDLEARHGELLPVLADPNAFTVGENLATAQGAVVYRNAMMELIQYTPTTEQVHKTPLVIFPPWINKFYILDLKPQNSLIRWVVDQGYTLFVVSWKNPDETYADTGFETYIEEGYLKAIDVACEITGEKQINAVGYCVAGTTLALTLALKAKRGQARVKSATFFTTLTDFTDQGEFTPFLDDSFVDAIERQVDAEGYLDSHYMSKTFSYLRPKDLVYGPAIRSYMMGEPPPAFDLLYWNGDSTNLPGKMTVQYLRGLCQANGFAADGFDLMGERLHVSDVTLPICAIACETDHIAAWKDSFRGVVQMGSKDKTFILSESGHIAGIVNPPSKKKYGHWRGPEAIGTPDAWKAASTYHEGSWWPFWDEWLSQRSGKMVPARQPGSESHPVLAAAPGTYVRETVKG
ncbi:PHA/PHB synthase family protein [Roseicyclus persicicus]|uniref:Class I poly(R)-hydroxyalkanoic acid synthase n=1 Tax=Roseicyclus persicicus TaxID=2650661 RepID=A0A7X6GYL1_9RHOB|nr:class I poly(R)-hydroxyalkanoic acid synthase [Roseibacterium persicicum]NKX43522.1 class I poly(R)-hydroxyalkanoic acid synthase [Roseibacterium persicicum]